VAGAVLILLPVCAFDIVVSFFLPANPFRFVAKAQSA